MNLCIGMNCTFPVILYKLLRFFIYFIDTVLGWMRYLRYVYFNRTNVLTKKFVILIVKLQKYKFSYWNLRIFYRMTGWYKFMKFSRLWVTVTIFCRWLKFLFFCGFYFTVVMVFIYWEPLWIYAFSSGGAIII